MTENERITLPAWKRLVMVLFAIIIFGVQVSVIVFLFFYYQEISKRFQQVYLVFEVIGALYVLYIIRKPINTSYKLTWSILILIFPIFFCILYSVNSTSRRLSKRKRTKIHKNVELTEVESNIEELKEIDEESYRMARILAIDTYAPCYSDSKVEYFSDISLKFEDMLKEIRNAREYIFIETFIISKGFLWDKLYEELYKKGLEGVQIRILYDDIGSRGSLTKPLVKKISTIPNCEIASFEPLGLNVNLTANYRDHRKITIIDGNVCYCGGDNLADEYIHKKERFGFWRDSCMKYYGRCIFSFTLFFSEMWYSSTKKVLKFTKRENEYKNYNENEFVVPFGDGPLYTSHTAYDLFISMISQATSSIYISTPYFIIDSAIIDLLAIKIRSGIDVKILMPKIPDKKIPFYMGRANYRELLKAGGGVYEYTPGFNHSKAIIIDNKYAFIGTINVDYRSLFLHYECGALVANSKEINKMTIDFNDAINESEKIEYDKWRKRPFIQKIIAFIANIFAPMF